MVATALAQARNGKQSNILVVIMGDDIGRCSL
jgi:hypothetical protein